MILKRLVLRISRCGPVFRQGGIYRKFQKTGWGTAEGLEKKGQGERNEYG